MFLWIYRFILRGPKYKGRHRIESWLKQRLSLASDVVFGNVQMVLDPQEWIQISLLSGEPQEPLTANLVARLLKTGDTMLDIGAHVGWLSLIGAKAVGPAGTIVAVDPQPYNCDRILTNAALNGFDNILVVVGAVGEKSRPVCLPNQSVSDKALLTLAGPGVNDTALRFLVQSFTLPELVEVLDIGSIKLLKVDVEGFELPVFRAAVPVLARIENVIFEQLPEYDTDFAAVRGILEDAGFDLLTVDGQPARDGQVPENNVWARRLS